MYGGNSVTKWATEYWIHFEGGDLHVLEGKQWRKWKDYIDHSFEGDKVILIERVKTEYDESSTYDREYETMWEVTE
tara:strand:- start:386 stop:613 length:228 start_codon:yes stop_codon:yes gene_type:complete